MFLTEKEDVDTLEEKRRIGSGQRLLETMEYNCMKMILFNKRGRGGERKGRRERERQKDTERQNGRGVNDEGS